MSISGLETAKKELEEDLQRWSDCPPETRECLLAAMPKTKTAMGAIVIARTASEWLRNNPADAEIRSAALSAIDTGRQEILTVQMKYYHAEEKVAEAHDKSLILRLLDGRQTTSSRFIRAADMLDEAEYAVMLPDIAQKQAKWRVKALTSIACHELTAERVEVCYNAGREPAVTKPATGSVDIEENWRAEIPTK